MKPFEVYPSFTPIISTWRILSKRLKKHEELQEAFLLRSEINDTKFGFISTSVWGSKESFKRAISSDTLLKLHHSTNGRDKTSVIYSLYKTIYENGNSKIPRRSVKAFLCFIRQGESKKEKLLAETENLEKELSGLNIQYKLKILKSIYAKNKIGYIMLLHFSNKGNIKFFLTGIIDKHLTDITDCQNSVYKIESYIKNHLNK
ncbi:MAG: hypothetical protein HY959_02420 [Ignavibacteriae bacterium]|nr:hypothetical protein [Ignavibacteriota bacterium]